MKITLVELFVIATGVLMSACGANASSSVGEDVAVQAAPLSADSSVYFRCNATGWGVDDSTRLSNFAGANVLARTYNVTQSWMLLPGDSCILTETNQVNGWGTSQIYYTASTGSVVVPPGTASLVTQAGGNPTFTVDYSVLGQHRIIANFSVTPPTIQIQSAADACAGVCPGSLRCVLGTNGIPTCVEDPPTGP